MKNILFIWNRDVNVGSVQGSNDDSIKDFNNINKLTGSKMQKVVELIEKIRDKKEKVVVFS